MPKTWLLQNYSIFNVDFRYKTFETGTKDRPGAINVNWTRANLINILIYMKNKLIRKMAFLPLSAISPKLSFLRSDCILYVHFKHETLENGTIKPHLEN